MIAVISASSAVIGGIISFGGNYLIEWKKTRREEKKRLEDKEALDLKLRNDAYIKFLELKDQDVQDVSHQ
jgi:hypothetical protein